jgi:hypothetical protein
LGQLTARKEESDDVYQNPHFLLFRVWGVNWRPPQAVSRRSSNTHYGPMGIVNITILPNPPEAVMPTLQAFANEVMPRVQQSK